MRRALCKSYSTEPIVEPNVFIGGVSATYDSESSIATALGLSAGDISLFSIDGNNISFRVETNFTLQNDSFRDITIGDVLTYFIDVDGYCLGAQGSSFRLQNSNTVILVLPNATTFGTECFLGSRVSYLRLPNMTNLGFKCLESVTLGKRYYVPNSTFGANNLYNRVFRNCPSTLKVYHDSALLTSNGGGLEGDLDHVLNDRGGSIQDVQNFTAPSSVTDLSASSITSNSVDLNFTVSSSTNTLDFYEVWIDDGTNNPRQLYHFWDEISSSGDTLTGLTAGTTYTIKIVACDIYIGTEVHLVIQLK